MTSKPSNPIGKRLRELRKDNDWTLAEVSRRTGISVATLSKLENGKTELNFSSVNKLAEGLDLPVTEFTTPQPRASGRRAVTVCGHGVVFRTDDVDYEVLCSELAHQDQAFLTARVKSHSFPEGLDWHRHTGQEFLYVLQGQMELHTEMYEPLLLKQGDSVVFDSSMGHHYVSRGRGDARILVSMSIKGYKNVAVALRPGKRRG